MHIHLDRKKLLFITFFLCCILPTCFTWFTVEGASMSWRGMSLMGSALLAGMALYAFALLFDRFGYVLIIGILAHLTLLCDCLNCFFNFTVLTNMAEHRDIPFSVDAARPFYWVSLGLIILHLALFTTTEIAVQRLKKHKSK